MKSIFVLCAILIAVAFGADVEEMKDKRALYGFGYGFAPGYSGYTGGYPGAASFVHGYHGYGYRGIGGGVGYPYTPYNGYHHPHAYTPGGLAYHGAHFGYGGPFLH
uniref:Putative pupal cuticle protein edg-91 n=1 Tax=Nyssomyia neivai TaxID=330878 RepID=A0A1L8E366_9DIPT